MSGRVLVKGITSNIVDNTLSVPSAVTVLEFINCQIIGNGSLEGTKNTRLISLYANYPVDSLTPASLYILNFGGVEDCKGALRLQNCDNVAHSQITSAINCTNLTNIYCTMNSLIGDVYFNNCSLINGVSLDREENYQTYVEFKNCRYISNVRDISPEFDPSHGEGKAVIDYVNCDWVDGDTCDGYYATEDNGKVQTVNTSGAKSLISVYNKTEIDGMVGNISTALDELHTYAQSLVNGGATV